MHVTILTIGSRGDVQPFIALGLGLQQAGHAVKLATHPIFAEMVRERGLQFVPIEGNPQELIQSEAGQAFLKTSRNPLNYMRRFVAVLETILESALIDSWNACQGTDAIVTGSIAFWGVDIAEALGVPCYFAALQPFNPTQAFPLSTTPPGLERLGGVYNRLTYSLYQLVWQLLRQPVNQFRQSKLKLEPIPLWQTPLKRMERRQIHFLHAFSPTVIPKPKDWSDRIHVTGYWFLDRPPDFIPPQAVVDFLAAGSPPVYIGFGSMSDRDPATLTEIAISALKRTGRRGILLTGWGGISNADLPDEVLKLESIPHDWLFPQMACIVHHGGAGTTAAGLRAGVPNIIIPFFADQPFWGYRVAKLGVGTKPIPKKDLTVERLAEAIQVATTDENMRSRAAILGKKIQAEDGVGQAVRVII